MSKAQSWSVDVVLAVIIFMAAFFLFYPLLKESPSSNVQNLKDDASNVIKQVSSEDNPLGVLNKNEIDVDKLNELKNISYSELKQRLRTEGEFCIYMEDEQGNIVLINDSYKAIGSPDINISGTPCSQK